MIYSVFTHLAHHECLSLSTPSLYFLLKYLSLFPSRHVSCVIPCIHSGHLQVDTLLVYISRCRTSDPSMDSWIVAPGILQPSPNQATHHPTQHTPVSLLCPLCPAVPQDFLPFVIVRGRITHNVHPPAPVRRLSIWICSVVMEESPPGFSPLLVSLDPVLLP